MVPQEQYDALKTRFIENETATQRRLESINDLEATIKRGEQEMRNMEKMFLDKLEEAKKELEEFKAGARESEKTLTQEIKTGKEELAKAQAERDEHITKAGSELNEVREARDSLI